MKKKVFYLVIILGFILLFFFVYLFFNYQRLRQRLRFQPQGLWALYLDCPNTTYHFCGDNYIMMQSCDDQYLKENKWGVYNFNRFTGELTLDFETFKQELFLEPVDKQASDYQYFHGDWYLVDKERYSKYWLSEKAPDCAAAGGVQLQK